MKVNAACCILLLAAFAHAAIAGDDLDLGAMIQPASPHARLIDPQWETWGGSPIRSDDGKYHLYYSRWPAKFGFAPGWAIHSEIAHAVADQPAGPYHFVDVALPPRGINPGTGKKYWDADVTHNPNIIRWRDKYCLFYMGNYGDGTYAVHRNHQRVGVAIADSPNGPWQRFDQPIIDVSSDPAAFDSLCTTNPAAVVRPDGKILVIYKAVQIKPGKVMGGAVRFGAAVADQPQGPYAKTPGRIFEAAHDDGKTWMFAEDPFIWFSRQGDRYYAVARDVIGAFTGERGGIAMFQSPDGLNWQPAAHPKVLGAHFTWADGSPSRTRVERPQLLFDPAGHPLVLFAAANGYPPKGQVAFNIPIPLTPANTAASTAPSPITRTLDASHQLGPFPDLVAYRNTSIQKAPAPALAVRSEAEFGKAKITRCWLNLDEFWDYRTGAFDDNPLIGVHRYDNAPDKFPETWPGVVPTRIHFNDYLAAFSDHSDAIMLCVRRYERDVLDAKIGVTLADWKRIFKHAVKLCRQRCPNLRYVEACNEYAGRNFIHCNGDEYYRFYRQACQAVNEVNAELHLAGDQRILIGGPVVTGGDILPKLDRFFKNFHDDPAPDKRLDFVSWHEYERPIPDTARREAAVRALLRKHDLSDHLPLFITEHDPYHHKTGQRQYNLLNAAALVKSLYFTHEFSPDVGVFPWVQYHNDAEQTRFMWFDGPNAPDTTPDQFRLLPIGCSMKCLAMHRRREIAVTNDLAADHIVLASADSTGLCVEVVNYAAAPRDVRIRLTRLPRVFPNHTRFHLDAFLIDQSHSNCVSQPDRPGALEKIADTTASLTDDSLTLDHTALAPNAILLWRLTPSDKHTP